MKFGRKLFVLITVLFYVVSCQQPEKKPIKYVDLFIGTGPSTIESSSNPKKSSEVSGQTIPAVTAPFGMTQWTPQIYSSEEKCLAPFYLGSQVSQGFRATHWTSGSCVQDYGSFTIFATDFNSGFKYLPNQRKTYTMFDGKTATPAYMAVNYATANILGEVTATKRSGFFRFSYLFPENPAIVIDVNNDKGEGYIKIDLQKQEVVGYNPVRRIYNGNGESAGIAGYFVIKFDKEIIKYGTYNGPDYDNDSTEVKNKQQIGAFVTFKFDGSETLKTKIGTSFTSIENARKNLEAEIPDWDFDKTKADLEKEWNDVLGRIDVEGGVKDDTTKFYTAMYHSLLHPRLYSDVNGDYPGFDGDSTIHNSQDFSYYDDFSSWDIFRAQMPLLSLITPHQYNDMIKSLIAKSEQGGWLPIFPMWNSYTSAMIGDHNSAIIADAAMKGFDFDLEEAYKYMRKNAYETPENLDDYIDGKGRRALESYLELGYIPLEEAVDYAFHKEEQVSRTLEYAYDDWAVAQVAKKLGKTNDYNDLMARSYNYSNVYDPDKGWVCGRFADETFTENFNANGDMPYITEGTPKQYTWFVPHDVKGLIELMGGKETFHSKLSELVDKKEYWHGNEPSHQIPYMFNYVDDWEKTQQTVKNILKTEYGAGPGGLAGNDDAGQMSAWYVFGAIGFYPVCPGSNEYQLSSPVFEKVTLNLDKKYYPGGKFVLTEDPGNNYNAFSSVKLNGKESGTLITHEDIQKGGKLSFSMK